MGHDTRTRCERSAHRQPRPGLDHASPLLGSRFRAE
jgi:hypothetical protein